MFGKIFRCRGKGRGRWGRWGVGGSVAYELIKWWFKKEKKDTYQKSRADTSLRQILIVDKEKCTGCKSCLSVCQRGAIEIKEDLKAEILMQKCNLCGECMKVCKKEAILLFKEVKK